MIGERTILIAGMGTSPAVLTETVWALCHQKKPIVPDEGVVYAFCEMHNKCTKCTTDILWNKSPKRKTASKMGAISTKGVTFQQANAGVNTTQKGSQESSQEILLAKVSEGARKIYEMISKDGSLRIKDMAADIGVSTRMVMKYLKELEPLGVRHVGSTKKGRWVIGA